MDWLDQANKTEGYHLNIETLPALLIYNVCTLLIIYELSTWKSINLRTITLGWQHKKQTIRVSSICSSINTTLASQKQLVILNQHWLFSGAWPCCQIGVEAFKKWWRRPDKSQRMPKDGRVLPWPPLAGCWWTDRTVCTLASFAGAHSSSIRSATSTSDTRTFKYYSRHNVCTAWW